MEVVWVAVADSLQVVVDDGVSDAVLLKEETWQDTPRSSRNVGEGGGGGKASLWETALPFVSGKKRSSSRERRPSRHIRLCNM